jgi:hypothetical protein
MPSRQRARETHIQVRSLSGQAESGSLRKSRWQGLLFYVVFLVELHCLSSFAGAPQPDPGVGLFLRSPAPVLPSSVSNQLNKGWTHLSVAIAFDGSGNTREAHVIKSSGVPAADEAVRNWIQARWKARPEVAQAGVYKGLPLDSTEFTLPMVLIRK